MRHELPELQTLLHSDFLLVNEDGGLSGQGDHSGDTPVLYLKNHETHYLPYSIFSHLKALPVDQLPWLPVQAVAIDESFEQVYHNLQNRELIVAVDEQQTPVGFVKTTELASETMMSYRYLRAYFETMIETMDASISAVNEHKETVIWTSGAEQIFSIKKEDILGHPMTKFFPEKMLQCINTLKSGHSVYRKQHQPREDLFVLINANPIMLDDKIVGAVVAETDVTSQVRLNQELYDANRKIHDLRQQISKLNDSVNPFYTIKGSSRAIKKTIEKMEKVGSTQARVLILGETGVGKELFAKALHDAREEENAPFIAVNCGAIPPTLFESDLFGYERGAFSGADSNGKKGKIELARRGTLFLDEIGELPFDMQVKLLRVLQEKKYYSVGGTRQLDMDCRIIAATNQNLEEMVKEGRFREDLYYRLNIISIKIPPLRERKEDLVELTHQFLYEFSIQYSRDIKSIPKDVMKDLLDYHWPGNIRELRNVVERLVVFATDGIIQREDLPFSVDNDEGNPTPQALTLAQEVQRYEKKVILQAIEEADGNKLAAAGCLGVSRATLYNKMNKLGLEI